MRECRSIRSGAYGLPYYCTPPVCVPAVIGEPAAWWHNKNKNNNENVLQSSVLFFLWFCALLRASLCRPDACRRLSGLILHAPSRQGSEFKQLSPVLAYDLARWGWYELAAGVGFCFVVGSWSPTAGFWSPAVLQLLPSQAQQKSRSPDSPITLRGACKGSQVNIQNARASWVYYTIEITTELNLAFLSHLDMVPAIPTLVTRNYLIPFHVSCKRLAHHALHMRRIRRDEYVECLFNYKYDLRSKTSSSSPASASASQE